jgi:PAS domain S-box-containing protein
VNRAQRPGDSSLSLVPSAHDVREQATPEAKVKKPPIPANEEARLAALRAYEVLDTPAEAAFDALTTLAAHIARVPIALVSLIDVDRQWFKSRYGLDAPETPRDVSFCGHVVASDAPLVVRDAFADDRFADNPLVTGGPRVRFYAGVPLRTADGFVLGTLCAIDHEPRELTPEQHAMLGLLARQVVDQLELRRQTLLLAARQADLEAALRSASDVASRLASILASANYGIIETTPDGTIRVFNAAAERMLGYAACEVVGRTTPVTIHLEAEIAARAEELSAELGFPVEPGFETFVAKARRGGADEHEWTCVRKDGSRFPVALSVTTRRDAFGEVVGFLGIASDITERKRIESALKHHTALLDLSAEVAIAFTMHDSLPPMLRACAAAIVKHLDAAFARIWTLDEAGKTLELRASAGQYTHLDGAHGRVPVGQLKIGRIALERKPHLTNSVVGDPLFGDQAWATREGMVSFAGYPLLLDDRLIGVLAMFSRHPLEAPTLDALGVVATNISLGIERKYAAARLKESEVRTRSIIDAAVDPVVTIDDHGVIDHVNPAVSGLFGYTPEELLGQNVSLLMPSPDRELHDSYLATYRQTSERRVIGSGREVTAIRKDGTTFPAELAVSEFFIDNKQFFTGVVRDISDRKRIATLQSEFVSTVSHELRTPLTSIRGALGLVAGGVTGELPKEAKEYVDIALTNSDRLVRLINDILDIEKMHSGTMAFRMKAADLRASVESAVASNQAFAASHHVRVVLDPEVPEGEVLVDPDRLAQVFSNLISNAAKFSPPDARVELAVRRFADRFRISVRDHGPGIPEEFQERIFQRFAQADASSTRQKGGTGLGLSISKAIIERMRGTISYRRAPGGGTVFYVELPYLAPVISSEPRQAGLDQVLVCEDDPDVSRVLEKLLVSSGLLVHVAPTLERARRLLATHSYSAITLDLLLADGDATQLIQELRSADATRLIPIVVVTGTGGSLGPTALSVTDVVTKPFDEQLLLTAVQNAIAACRNEHPRLLHVEDDEDIRRVVRRTLPDSWTVTGAGSVQAAKKALANEEFDVVLLDLSLPDGTGDELIRLVGRAQVIIFSALDASAEVSRRVTTALVKSRSNPVDVCRVLVSSVRKHDPRRERP